MSRTLSQQFVIENIAGAGGTTGSTVLTDTDNKEGRGEAQEASTGKDRKDEEGYSLFDVARLEKSPCCL